DDFTYTAEDQVQTEKRYNTAGSLVGTSSYTYDGDGNMKSVTQANASSTVLASYAYSYDQADRLTAETDDGSTTSYTYDADNELIGSTTSSFSYDATGNRTMTYDASPTSTMTADYVTGKDNELISDGVYTYTYDAAGNRVAESLLGGLNGVVTGVNDTTWIYTYDSHNRMVAAEEYSNSGLTSALYEETYTYDVLGDRVEQVSTNFVTTTVTQFVYDRGNVLLDLSSTGTVQSRYMWGDQADQILAREDAGGAVAWYLTDHLGSVRNVTDATGAIAGTITYDAFGNITNDTNASFEGRYKYTGKEFDAATDLQYNDNRYYDPATGRWTSQDPLGFRALDPDLYRYVGNGPTDTTDSSGEAWGNWVQRVPWTDQEIIDSFRATYGNQLTNAEI